MGVPSRDGDQKDLGTVTKSLRKVYGSFTGFDRSPTGIARVTIAQQEVSEVPQMNNLKIRVGLIALLVCVSLLLMGAAQDTNDKSRMTRTVTGCVQTGDHANEYRLIAESAKWHVKSDTVRLADHVGHEVKVEGVVSNAAFHGMKEDLKAEVEKKPIETGVLTVTNLEMVSERCN